MSRVSVILITLDEEANIVPCLQTVAWADEIVLVDTGSRDRTLELARQFTDRIFTISWPGYGAAKNFALAQAAMEWVFSLDADERVSPALGQEIREVIRREEGPHGYRIPRKNYFAGRWVRRLGWYPDYTLRLFRRGQGRFRERAVHEEVEVAGPVGRLKNPLDHYSYASVSEYLSRQDRYARLAAQEMHKEGRRPVWGELAWRPPLHFFKLYVLRLGFLEGRLGYTLALLGSLYNFLKYYYLRELSEKEYHED
uniref:Glycosyltransferase family 2 protein n=1 Tax=Desulfobacca acetoxidans TaxID=60893 RepID=A0A7V4G8V5_9BACT